MNNEILAMLDEIRPEFDFTDSEDFVLDGLLDSFDVISLTNMIEEKYNVKIDGTDIVPENYASLEAICALIKKAGGTV